MIAIPTLATYLRLSPADGDDLLLVQELLDGAVERVEAWLDRPLFAPGAMPDPAPAGAIEANAAIRHAIMILMAAAYDHRNGDLTDPELGMPPAAHDLLIAHRCFHTPAPVPVTTEDN